MATPRGEASPGEFSDREKCASAMRGRSLEFAPCYAPLSLRLALPCQASIRRSGFCRTLLKCEAMERVALDLRQLPVQQDDLG